MKSPIIAAVLLVLAVPAFAAAELTATPAQWKDIHAFEKAWTHCGGYDGEDDLDLKKTCAVADRLEKKLVAQGFCIMGHVTVGRAGRPWTQKEWERTGGQGTVSPKGRKHCYILHHPAALLR